MIEAIQIWDRYAFEAINSGMSNPFLDWLMPFFRNGYIWAPVYMFFAVFVIRNFGTKGIYIVLFGITAFLLSDQISSNVIKPLIGRPRPCVDPYMIGHVKSLVPCGAGFSFPSSHATNHFAFSVFIILVLPVTMRWVLPVCLTWAAGVAFAQIYVGLHYPVDTITGALLGSIIGYSIGTACKYALNLNLDRDPEEEEVIEAESETLE
jgi:membrane-associated phospholipid phosphatase